MGRVVQEESIALSQDQQLLLRKGAAVRASNLGEDTAAFDAAFQELMVLMPGTQEQLLRLNPVLLSKLCSDTSAVAQKLITLRSLLPSVDISSLVQQRPTLLLDSEFCEVAPALSKLRVMFPEGGVEQLVTVQPLLLVAEVDEIVGELERLLGLDKRKLQAALLKQPQLFVSAMSNRKLSLWLMPGVDAARLILGDPAIVLTLQRGSKSLGPGAEYMQTST